MTTATVQRGPRVAAFFHYYEVDRSYRDNLVFFLSRAWCPEITIFLVISGDCSVPLPVWPNLRVIRAPNKNYDFGAYSAALKTVAAIEDYDYFIFVNSSTRGPFLPPGDRRPWYRHFTDRLTGSTHLVGSSVNVLAAESKYAKRFKELYACEGGYAHIQTTAYALTTEAVRELLQLGVYADRPSLSKAEVVVHYELRISREILRRGWQAECLLPGYEHVDIGSALQDPNATSRLGDPLYHGAYFGRTVLPHEVIFLKMNRDLVGPAAGCWLTLRELWRAVPREVAAWGPCRKMRRDYALRLVPLCAASALRKLVAPFRRRHKAVRR